MAEKPETTQRRVYTLPNELVTRILAFQEEKGLPSEVEAVRRLLDEALKHRDSDRDIVNRMIDRTKLIRMPAEAARDVLVGHPLVEAIGFEGETVTFRTKNGGSFRILPNGKAEEETTRGWVDFDDIPF